MTCLVVPLFLLLIALVLRAKRNYFSPSSSAYQFKDRSRSILSALGGPRVYGDYVRRGEHASVRVGVNINLDNQKFS